MKTKVIILQILFFLIGNTSNAQTAAVADLSTHGVQLTPRIAAKLTRLELIKLDKYKVLDRFDIEAIIGDDQSYKDCYGKKCLHEMGKKLKVDYIFSGSIDALGNKIVIAIKVIDVETGGLYKTKTMEFEDHADEIPRMVEIMLKEMHGQSVDQEIKKQLTFNQEPIFSNDVGKINNSGPRFGVAYAGYGDLNSFLSRPKREGGLESLPLMSNIGYQFEFQYVGTENFSALFEIIPNIAGMEQGNFIPTVSFLNGFRFGTAGWEFAFGPSFGGRRVIDGVYTENGFKTRREYLDDDYNNWIDDPANYNPTTGEYYNSYSQPSVDWESRMDTRGDLQFNTNWLMGFGRTFKSGALNIPVNVYYSGNQFGGVFGASVGFNVTQSKRSINSNKL